MVDVELKTVRVAVGVIFREGAYYLTKRLYSAHQGGKWEFPGGKVEKNESVAQALSRELKEEVGIDVLACQPLRVIEHDYGDKKVRLEVFIVDQFLNEPSSQEGLEGGWFSLEDMLFLDFPAANREILTSLNSMPVN